MDVGATIRAARRAEGVSQAQLAERIGSTQPQVSAWERGTRSPKASDLQRIAEALGRVLQVSLEQPRVGSTVGRKGFDDLLGKHRGAAPAKRRRL